MIVPVEHHCEMMDSTLAFGETGLAYYPNVNEYGLKVMDGGTGFIVLKYCPWCAAELPESRREEYFGDLEARGLI